MEGLTSSFPNGIDSFLIDDQAVKKTSTYLVVTNTDSGKTFYQTATCVFTLPAIDTGQIHTFVNLADDGVGALRIVPDSSDGIFWQGDEVVNKYIENTLATSKKGDQITISYAAALTWQVTNIRGIWVKEA
jgi:hypothetical protein